MSIMPPDGWSIDVGTWGTDVDIDTAVSQSGFSSLKIDCTADVTIYSDWMPVVGVPQTSTDVISYEFHTVMYSSDSTNNLITMELEVYESDRTTSVSTKNLIANSGGVTVPGTSTWNYYGRVVWITNAQNTARWARLKITSNDQAGASDGHVWIDRCILKESPPYGYMFYDGGSYTASGSTNIAFDNKDNNRILATLDTGGGNGGKFTVLEPGTYLTIAKLSFDTFTANNWIDIRIVISGNVHGPVGTQTTYHTGTTVKPVTCVSVSSLDTLNKGDTVGLAVSASVNATIIDGDFSIVKTGT